MEYRLTSTLSRAFAAAALILLGAGAAPAADAAGGNAAGKKTGTFQVQITQRSKNTAMVPLCARLGWGTRAELEAAAKKNGTETDYNLSNETFEAFVPEDYTGAEPYGLIVWISP